MLWTDHLLARGGPIFKHHVAGVVDDAGDRDRRDPPSSGREDGVCAGQLQQGDLAASQGKRKPVVRPGKGGDPHPPGERHQAVRLGRVRIVVHPNELQGFHCGYVVRVGQRRPDRLRPVKPFVVIDRPIGRPRISGVSRRRELRSDIPDQRCGRPAFFKGGRVCERLDRRARLPGTDGHVYLTVDGLIIKVRRTDHHQDLAG